MAEDNLACDKYESCRFRNGEKLDICNGKVYHGNSLRDIDFRYCAFYQSVIQDKDEKTDSRA